MRAILQKWLQSLRGRSARDQSPAAAPSSAPDNMDNTNSRPIAHHLARALDRALSLGLFEHAQRLAATAAPLAPGHAPLTERLARLRLSQGDPETGLRIIEACRERPSSLRLLRAVCLIQLGRAIEAQLDLHEWCRKASAPLDARVLLALLDWQRGETASAIDAVQRNLKHLEDPRSLQVLLLMSILRDKPAQARQWASRLRDAGLAAHAAPDIDLMLTSLDLPPAANQAFDPARIAALALELWACEQVIPALVEAQRRQPSLAEVRRLYLALEHALPDLANRSAAMEALTRLALIMDDLQAAALWADRGLAINAMSVPLSILAREVAARLESSAALASAAMSEAPDESAGTAQDAPRRWGAAA